ncbi:MAG: hypothetical protein ACNI25_01550 [Halarcobacter sp.]
MQIDTNSIDMATIRANSLDQNKYKNMDSSKLEDEALRKVSDDFESFFMQQLLDVSLKNVKFAGEGTGSDIIKGMYTEAIAKESAGTVGISDLLYNFLSERKK